MATEQRRRSSVGRLLSNLAPKRRESVQDSIELSPIEADLFVSYQLSLPDPLFLGPLALHCAHVVGSKALSIRAHTALLRHGIITPPLTTNRDNHMPVDTRRITKDFANQLFFCNAHTLRRIVALLFVFEEQCMRWKLILREQNEVQHILENPPEGLKQELELHLEATRRRMALLPSEQNSDMSAPDELPPAYHR